MASVAWRAETLKGAYTVHTLATIEAGVLLAIVHIHLAEFSLSARRAGAGEVPNQVIACAAVSAWLSGTVVDIVLALDTLEALGTGAAEGGAVVEAGGSIQARVGGTSIRSILAVGAGEPIFALTSV